MRSGEDSRLMSPTTGDPLAPAYSLIVADVVSLLTVVAMRETARRPLALGSPAAVGRPP